MSTAEKENHVDATTLRAELKSWENAFKEKTGRKPGRADIKNDATIAAKYKLYDRTTRQKPTASNQTPRKSTRPKPSDEPVDQPKFNISATPRKTPSKRQSAHLPPPAPSPTKEIEATPAHIKCALGPTPLKNGQVLSIFDIPSATPLRDQDGVRTGTETLIAGTPSKGAQVPDSPFGRTPQSSGKRNFLSAFAGTPLKRKRDENDIGTTSSSKRKFATPAFLRRSFPLASIDEESAETTAARPPFRRRGLVRSLSSIIQNLKKQEDERMDDEWDIMNEIEEEQENGGEKPKKTEVPKVVVQDSQAAEMPLGPDEAPVSDEESGEEQDKARKPWKKKGLKRQTRRVNMKPVLHQTKKAGELEPWDEESETEIVPETQLQEGLEEGIEGEDDADSGSDGEGKKSKKKKKKSTAKDGKEKEKAKPRKVNPDAHANYRALKIKNKNSKAGGRGKRFGRR